MPWSVRLVFVLVLASAAVFAWSKRPFVSDAEKVCWVAELSGCPSPEGLLAGNDCKIAWLERSMWSFARLGILPRGGGPDGGDSLRALAHEAGVSACPEADVVDREFARRQAERDQRALPQPEPQPGPAPQSSDQPEAPRRVRGVVKSKAPSVDGEIDPSLVIKEVRARIGAVKACYERGLSRQSDLAGQVTIRWTITPAGTVSGVEVAANEMGDAEVAACIKGLVVRWRFVAPAGGAVDVVYPFVFEVAP